jgi:hypothetical protein
MPRAAALGASFRPMFLNKVENHQHHHHCDDDGETRWVTRGCKENRARQQHQQQRIAKPVEKIDKGPRAPAFFDSGFALDCEKLRGFF